MPESTCGCSYITHPVPEIRFPIPWDLEGYPGITASWGIGNTLRVEGDSSHPSGDHWHTAEFKIKREETGCPSGTEYNYTLDAHGSHNDPLAQISQDSDTIDWRWMLETTMRDLKERYNLSHCLSKISIAEKNGRRLTPPLYLPCWLITLYVQKKREHINDLQNTLLQELKNTMVHAYTSMAPEQKPRVFSYAVRTRHIEPMKKEKIGRPVIVPAFVVFGEEYGGTVDF
ncbi:hypothetical protein F5Y18DRAFT_432308 [Xylariaceae sp. FL1019]|nr:hypothetical protein F5Y18DRAFT_432308 [Xylariaceae sp. FL1019]